MLITLNWTETLVVVFVSYLLSTLSLTLYLHRALAHQCVIFHPMVTLMMRLWLWLTGTVSGHLFYMVHKEHHLYPDTPNDPHSPVIYPWWRIVFFGLLTYAQMLQEKKNYFLLKYPHIKFVPNDRLERSLLARWPYAGVLLTLLSCCLLFGWKGVIVWLGVVGIAIPIVANSILTGFGHLIGYRNFNLEDNSRNFYLSFICSFFLFGENLHNNHHFNPKSANFAHQWCELDLGYLIICLLEKAHLAKVIGDRSLSVIHQRKKQ